MKKLLLLSSIILVSLSVFLFACKAKRLKKSTAVESEELAKEKQEQVSDEIDKPEQVIIHQPGVINQGSLDSIKAVRKKQKKK